MKARFVVKSLVIAAGLLVWVGVLALTLFGFTPGWVGLVALGLVPILGCYLWISDDIRSRRTDPFRPASPKTMVEYDGKAPSREEYMRPKPMMRDGWN